MRQTIEIEVPEGKVAVYKDGKITFENQEHYKTIRSIEDAISWVNSNTNDEYSDLIQDYYSINDEYFQKFIALKLIYIALTKNRIQNLISGYYYYPWICVCNEDFNTDEYTILGNIKLNNNKQYKVLGGRAYSGSGAGLCDFVSVDGVSLAAANVAMFGFCNINIAKYMSTQFGKLLFEIIYKFQNVNWRWV